jgi:L-threonylcarbamoyladenylate synthase
MATFIKNTLIFPYLNYNVQIIKINPKQPEEETILKAVGAMETGGIVVYPTETVYGLGTNAFDKKAVEKVYAIKSRGSLKPLSVAVKNLDEAERFAVFSNLALKVAKKFLPGPLTLVLPIKDHRLEPVSAGRKTVGIRIPDNIVAMELLNSANFPITATSANLSGREEPITANDVINQIGDEVDFILDAGKCGGGVPSTIVSVINDQIKIIREGAIPEEEILKIKK